MSNFQQHTTPELHKERVPPGCQQWRGQRSGVGIWLLARARDAAGDEREVVTVKKRCARPEVRRRDGAVRRSVLQCSAARRGVSCV